MVELEAERMNELTVLLGNDDRPPISDITWARKLGYDQSRARERLDDLGRQGLVDVCHAYSHPSRGAVHHLYSVVLLTWRGVEKAKEIE